MMASAELAEELNCSICLELYKEPIMLRCGHNFCQSCIAKVLDTQEDSEVYTCPECRKEFPERPLLLRNLKLCNIVEYFLPAMPKKEQTGIFCTYCDTNVPAAKTCLLCDASLCDAHLKKHSKSEEHVLIEPTASPENRKCSIHKKILEYYCCEDGTCVCISCCLVGEHKGHKLELLADTLVNRKEKLRNGFKNLTSVREELEIQIQGLQGHRKDVQDKVANVEEKVTRFFREMHEQLHMLEKQVQNEIKRQENQLLVLISDQIQELETKKDELSGKIIHIEEMCNHTDPLTVLREEQGTNDPHPLAHNNKNVACNLDESTVLQVLHKGLVNLTKIGIEIGGKKRFFVPVTSDFVLDEKTANNHIYLSLDLKSAFYKSIKKSQTRSEGPERFKSCHVLGSRGFSSGQHYWEVDVRNANQWLIGVAYQSIERKVNGYESWIGFNEKSWSFGFQKKEISIYHKAKTKKIVLDSPVQSVGIFLNYEAGLLSFYQLSSTKRHLHTYTATFTEPLHAAFHIYKDTHIRIINQLSSNLQC